jgi:hypothetical protein
MQYTSFDVPTYTSIAIYGKRTWNAVDHCSAHNLIRIHAVEYLSRILNPDYILLYYIFYFYITLHVLRFGGLDKFDHLKLFTLSNTQILLRIIIISPLQQSNTTSTYAIIYNFTTNLYSDTHGKRWALGSK